ncbi:MAG: PQQ-binding-like beta-propeller repeat protein, partial [Gemmataceae bacterium]
MLTRHLAFVLLLISVRPILADWPQWRGPKNDGHSPEKNLPAEWSTTMNIAGKLPLPGPGASTPCIAKGMIFLTAQAGADIELHAISTDLKPVWKKTLGTSKATFRGDEGNLASASCSTDGSTVFAFTGTGKVAAFDFAGKELWGFDAQEKYGKFAIQFGIHQTPVLHEGRYYMT